MVYVRLRVPAIQETRILSLDLEDPLEEGLATHSSILAWRIPWTEEPAGYSPWGHKEWHMTEELTLPYLWFTYFHSPSKY